MNGIVDPEDERNASQRQDGAVPDRDSEVWLALAAARMGIWEWDLNSDAVRWSTATVRAHGLTPETVPTSGRAAFELVHPDDRQHHQEMCDRAIRDGTDLFAEYRIVAADGVHWVQSRGRVTYDAAGKPCRMLGVNVDITDQKLLDDQLLQTNQMRALTGRLMRAQDDERRRIAQMLHETTAQNLAGLKMLLARLNRTSDRLSDDERNALGESMSLAEQSMTEIRTLSYLLHPPFLDEAGLLSALRWYVAGFAERSGIDVDLDLPESLGRLARDTETALFRIVQESLINIHRHAGSKTANIRLQRDAETLVLEVDDQGHGIPNASLEHIMSGGGIVGVGIAGMSERMEQLGGSLEITSSDQGTTVRARLPLVKDAD
jgi:two-component system NarL family sensor kinase